MSGVNEDVKNTKTINMYSEKELWEQFLKGDETAFNRILTQYSEKMFNYGYRLCLNEELVKDCIQDIFLRLWNDRSSISPTDSITWYLLKCTKNSVLREMKKWYNNEELENDYFFNVEFDIETKLITDLENQNLGNKIKSLINQLPNRQKEILYLRFYDNLTLPEISELLDINQQSVYNLLQKAYKSFRSEWSPLITIFFLKLNLLKISVLLFN